MSAVLHTFQDWSGTLWGEIEVESMLDRCKQLSASMKQLPKAVRSGQTVGCVEQLGLAARHDRSSPLLCTCPCPCTGPQL